MEVAEKEDEEEKEGYQKEEELKLILKILINETFKYHMNITCYIRDWLSPPILFFRWLDEYLMLCY